MQDYTAEVSVLEISPYIGMTLKEAEETIKAKYTIVALLRGGPKHMVIPNNEILLADDVLIVRASYDDLGKEE